MNKSSLDQKLGSKAGTDLDQIMVQVLKPGGMISEALVPVVLLLLDQRFKVKPSELGRVGLRNGTSTSRTNGE
jgi:hypothetical protein